MRESNYCAQFLTRHLVLLYSRAMIVLGGSSWWCCHVFTRHPVAVETEAIKQAEMRTMSRLHAQAEQHAYTLKQLMPDHATEYTARIQSHAYCR